MKFCRKTIMRTLALGIIGCLIFIFCACTKEDKDWNNSYNSGKQLFDYTESNIGAFLSLFDLSLRMNTFVEKEKADTIRQADRLSSEYTISESDKDCWVGVDGSDTVFIIRTDGLCLATETAVWKIESRLPACSGEGVVSCTGWGRWVLELKDTRSGDWMSNVRLVLQYFGEELPCCLDMSDFTLLGSAESIMTESDEEGNRTLLNFEIAAPLYKAQKNNFLFDSGLLYMSMRDVRGDRERTAKAELRAEAGKNRSLQITYRGEVYSYQ